MQHALAYWKKTITTLVILFKLLILNKYIKSYT